LVTQDIMAIRYPYVNHAKPSSQSNAFLRNTESMKEKISTQHKPSYWNKSKPKQGRVLSLTKGGANGGLRI
jgi:hypothetical protein